MPDDVQVGAAALVKADKPKKSKKDNLITPALAKAMLLLPDERKCSGKVKLREPGTGKGREYLRDADGKILTRPCRQKAILGGFVCSAHGGALPTVKAKAEKRLLAMVEPSIARLEELAQQSAHLPTALAAVRTVLERAGTKTPIGAMQKELGDTDMRPIINIGIAVGGIAPKPDVKVGLLPPAVEGTVVGTDD